MGTGLRETLEQGKEKRSWSQTYQTLHLPPVNCQLCEHSAFLFLRVRTCNVGIRLLLLWRLSCVSHVPLVHHRFSCFSPSPYMYFKDVRKLKDVRKPKGRRMPVSTGGLETQLGALRSSICHRAAATIKGAFNLQDKAQSHHLPQEPGSRFTLPIFFQESLPDTWKHNFW